MNDWNYGVSGQAGNGLDVNVLANLSVETRHNEGIPNVNYDAGSTGVNQSLVKFVPKAQLEFNTVAGYQVFSEATVLAPDWDPADYDAVIVRSNDPLLLAPNYTGPATQGPIAEGFRARDQGGFNHFPASSQHYIMLDPRDFAEWTDFAGEHPARGGVLTKSGFSFCIRPWN